MGAAPVIAAALHLGDQVWRVLVGIGFTFDCLLNRHVAVDGDARRALSDQLCQAFGRLLPPTGGRSGPRLRMLPVAGLRPYNLGVSPLPPYPEAAAAPSPAPYAQLSARLEQLRCVRGAQHPLLSGELRAFSYFAGWRLLAATTRGRWAPHL